MSQTNNIIDGNYSPSFPPERSLYESLWKYVNPSGSETLSGSDAVPFFQKSEVDVGILRQIWSLSTVNNIMKKENFFTAVRYITMVQNGDIPLNQEKLATSSSIQFPPPKFVGVQLPPAAPPALPPPQAYAMTPEEQTKYLDLFKTYDQSKTGLLSQAILMPIFSKSNLPPPVINSIWALSDVDKDHMLSPIEFAIAFHLILCLSKKHLPLPPGLPAPLLALASAAVTTPPPRTPTQPAQQPKQTTPTSHKDTALPEPSPRREEIHEVSVPKSSDSISSGSLKYLLQRVVTEKISLSASITNSEADIESIKGRLSTSITEINGIESEIETIRNKLLEAYHIRGAIQFDEARSKLEHDRLSLVVTEGRREIARLTGDKIEPSPLLGQFGEKIATTAADGIRQATNIGTGSGEVVVLNSEIDLLNTTLNNLTSERSRLVEDSQRTKQSLLSTQNSITTETQNLVKQKQDLEKLKIENQRLQDELDRITRSIASQSSIQPTTPASVATPTPIQISNPIVVDHGGFNSTNLNGNTGFGFHENNSTTKDNNNNNDNNGFENSFDNGFGGFDNNNNNNDFNSTPNSGFDSFNATTNQSSFGGDNSGFGGFDTTEGSFDSFNSGFDAFGAKESSTTKSNVVPPAFSSSDFSINPMPTSSFSSFDTNGFDAFGTTTTTATSSSSTTKTNNAFDAFDF